MYVLILHLNGKCKKSLFLINKGIFNAASNAN